MSGEEPLVNNGEHLYYKNMAHKILRQSKIEETKKTTKIILLLNSILNPIF